MKQAEKGKNNTNQRTNLGPERDYGVGAVLEHGIVLVLHRRRIQNQVDILLEASNLGEIRA